MRLDMDCIRDLLLCVEENTGIRTACCFVDMGRSEAANFLGRELKPKEYQYKLLEKYDNDKLIYHVRYCIEAELFTVLDGSDAISIIIHDLTPSGHDLISNIRESQNWKQVKKVAGNVGSFSLSALTTIASGVITSLVKSQLNLA